MAKFEVERKFLVSGEGWRGAGRASSIRQGYLSTDPERVVRVRLKDGAGFLTIKGKGQISRREFEFPVPAADARELLGLCCGHLVEKTRYEVRFGDALWEVDEFSGDNAGLLIAELEAQDEASLDRALTVRPPWVGRDVSTDSRLANASLAERPFCSWPEHERRALTEG